MFSWKACEFSVTPTPPLVSFAAPSKAKQFLVDDPDLGPRCRPFTRCRTEPPPSPFQADTVQMSTIMSMSADWKRQMGSTDDVRTSLATQKYDVSSGQGSARRLHLKDQWPTFEEKMLRLWKEDMDVLKVEGGEAFYIKLEKDKEASDTADLPRGVLSSLTKKSMIEPQTTWPLVPPHPHGNTF